MMMKLRNTIPVIMFIVIAAFVATIFFSWGMDITGDRGGKATLAGSIGDEKVSLEHFGKQVESEREKLRQESSTGDVPAQQSRMVPRQLWERYINDHIINQAIEKLQLGASAEEIYQFMKNNPPEVITQHESFQTNKVFDTAKYVQWLNDPANFDQDGMKQFEQQIRTSVVPRMQLQQVIEAGALVTKVEVAQEYRAENEKAVFEYAKVAAGAMPVTDAEVTEQMVKKQYEANPDSFKSDDQYEFYYAKVPKVATANDENEIVQELGNTRIRILEKQSTFEEEAKAVSEDDQSAKQGGELGWFGKGQMVPEFEKAAFALDSGAISEPVKSAFGYHLIMVEGKEVKKGVVERVKARHILLKVRASTQTTDSLEQVADSIRVEVSKKGFGALIKERHQFKLDSVGPVKKNDQLPGLAYVPGVWYFAINGKEGTVVDKPLENDDGFYIFGFKKFIRKGVLPLEIVRKQIIESLKDSIRMDHARKALEAAMVKGSGAEVSKLSTVDPQVTSGVTDSITRMSYVPNIGSGTTVIATGFALPQGKGSSAIKGADGYYIIKPVWKKLIPEINWNDVAVLTLWQRMNAMAKQTLYSEWFSANRKQLSIQDNLDKYFVE